MRAILAGVAALAALVLGAAVATDASALTLKGGFGNDRLNGTTKADTLRGGWGNDRLYGRAGADRLFGDYGNDAIFGGAGRDTISGGDGNDLLNGEAGDDVVRGDDGNDRIFGGAGADRLNGGDGNDRIDGGRGRDTIASGEGNDTILGRDGEPDAISCGEGTDTVVADPFDAVAADCENVTPPEAKPAGTTRERPLVGLVATDDGWTVQVLGFAPDYTAAVMAENMFNSPPPAGYLFSVARVRATRTAAGSGEFDGSYRLRAVGNLGVVYTSFNNSCGVIPDPLPDPQVFTGGVIEGNVCWSVPAIDATTLVMVDSRFLGDRQTFIAFR